MSAYDPSFYKNFHKAVKNPEVNTLTIALNQIAHDDTKRIALLEEIISKIDNPNEKKPFEVMLQKALHDQEDATHHHHTKSTK